MTLDGNSRAALFLEVRRSIIIGVLSRGFYVHA